MGVHHFFLSLLEVDRVIGYCLHSSESLMEVLSMLLLRARELELFTGLKVGRDDHISNDPLILTTLPPFKILADQ